MRKLLVLSLALFLAPAAPGTELTDLGQGLAYLRVASVAENEAALRKATPGATALVLDLRYATADEAAAGILRTALAERPAGTFLAILVSPATPASLGPVIGATPALTLGAPGSQPAPKVIVQTDAAADRRAYDALATGTEIAKLITGRIEKERYDEATLVQEFKEGVHDPEPPAPADPTAPKSEVTSPKAPPPVPTDRVLQRAVHLHRALAALKR